MLPIAFSICFERIKILSKVQRQSYFDDLIYTNLPFQIKGDTKTFSFFFYKEEEGNK